jgi:hypothetical protein
MGFLRYKHSLTPKMKELPITSEAMLFYRTSCRYQDSYIKAQQKSGVDPPKVALELNFIRDYYKNNDLGQRDMDLIIEE